MRCLIPNDSEHPGAGSWVVDALLPDAFLRRLDDLYSTLPTAETAKPGCSTRRYYNDVLGCATSH